MVQVIQGPRRNGKTARLIEMAAKEGLYVVVPSERDKRSIMQQAKAMGIECLLFPLTMEEAMTMRLGNPYRVTKGRLLVNDADRLLESILGMRVQAMTVTTDEEGKGGEQWAKNGCRCCR